ncbi:MotA/TolQ/ExbB proton channel family protein [Moraxella catarrhalis]|nr:MotA/TolQ/ExbB proton channel family protein [Moraxella catarrhalis]
MNESISLISLVIEASIVVKLVMAILLLLSTISWVLIFHLGAKIGGVAKFDERFEQWFWTDEIDRQLSVVQAESERVGLELIFYTGFYDQNHTNQDFALSDE